jgi:hypothetical protein
MLATARRSGQFGWVLALGLVCGVTTATAQEPRFVVVEDTAGIEFLHLHGDPDKGWITEMTGSGGAFLDYDNDGWIDLLLVNALLGPANDPLLAAELARAAPPEERRRYGHRVFRNLGGRFEDVTEATGLGDITWGSSAAVADVDNDGFVDVYISAYGENRLYRNLGDGSFSPWQAGIEEPNWGTTPIFTDWDGDGDLDLYVTNYTDFDGKNTPYLGDGICFYLGVEVHCGPEGLLGRVDVFYRNNGDGTFEEWEGFEIDPDLTFGFAGVATDCDNDGATDLYIATDSTINMLFRRTEDGGLEDWSLFSGGGYSAAGREQAGMGVTAGDYDGDGDFDLYVTNFQNDYNTLYRNEGGCIFLDVTEEEGMAVITLPFMGWAPQFIDVDGDGDLDIFVANGHIYPQLDRVGREPWAQRSLLFANQLAQTGKAGFVEVGEQAGPGMLWKRSSRAALLGDYDNDADSDILLTNMSEAPTLLRNESSLAAPALRISLVGRSSNRSAYGAKISVSSGGRTQWFEHRHSDGSFGSNDARNLVYLPGGVADRVEVLWPSGRVTSLQGVDPGWIVLDEERGMIATRQE